LCKAGFNPGSVVFWAGFYVFWACFGTTDRSDNDFFNSLGVFGTLLSPTAKLPVYAYQFVSKLMPKQGFKSWQAR
jgi:hypothetical protein